MTQNIKDILAVSLIGAILFLPFLGGVHLFDWDEINFAEAAREMLVTDNYLRVQIDYQPFWEKPPLFLWFQAGAMQLFGINEYAARFPNAVCGVLTLVLLFLIGKKHFDRSFGWFWVLAYSGSILPHLYFKSGIIDPWFNLLIFLSLYTLSRFVFKKNKEHTISYQSLILSGIFAGLAIMTKGPAALLIIGLVLFVYWIMCKFRFFISVPQFLAWLLIAFGVTGIWFGIETWHNGTWFTEEFIRYQWRLFSTPDAGHKGFFGYHFVVLLLGCFPASLLALPAFKKTELSDYQGLLKRFMLILFWVVLILFSLVQSKIVHYSSLCYYPLTFLAALAIHRAYLSKVSITKGIKVGLLVLGLLIGKIVFLVPFLGQRIELLRPLFAKDAFALGNLEADVNWLGIESIAGLFLIGITVLGFYFLNKSEIKKGIVVLFGGTAIFVQATLFLFINNIEAYSQRAAIEFYEKLEGQDVYVTTVGFKSYAHLFYSGKQPGGDPRQKDLSWLLQGEGLDKDAYFVTKVHKRKYLDNKPQLELVGEKNGFVFYRRSR